MKTYKGYLLDLDGTIYHGNRVIPEAVTFIEYLQETKTPYLYVTNNSSTTAEKVAERLSNMGLPTTADQVYTTSMATAKYLSEQKVQQKTYFALGEEGLFKAMEEAGYSFTEENPSYVIIGIDRTLTYEKVATAMRAIRNGATFIATNADPALPTEHGLMPGNGALVAAVATASAQRPIIIGKPEPIIIQYALEKLGTKPEETIIVGDNLHTDIQAGINSGIDTLLVLSGYSTLEDADKHDGPPTYVEQSLLTWMDKIRPAL
ncbi:TIGR01457 family HAD-type hydrolase [Brevibacillus laterosporus]|nr:TIGR01457 family HAD-type hydrolase [Brevibacillus laterosporus]TPG69690.1 TIGR01457 family HAD-type hydrolase [Brevibacillus laterosporus]TPG90459.1 TIGR01457 family HAD-type hydrolase [Brevibacillus laterosporus]